MDLYEELLELVLAYSSDQVKYLANWIIDYDRADNKRERDLRLEKQLYMKRFERMTESFELAKPKEKGAKSKELFEYYAKYVQPLIPNRHRYAIDEFCFKERWREAAETLAEIDGEIEAGRYENEYERLVTDTEYLLGQLVRVMKSESARRLERAKRAVNDYLVPHRDILERLARNQREAREGLERLARSELAREDKAELGRLLEDRIAEMAGLEARERGKVRDLTQTLGEMQRSERIFEKVVDTIERKKDLIEERRGYKSLLGRLEVETTEMDRLFFDLDGGLAKDSAKARESIELLASAFQDRILDVINDQERVNRILEGDAGPRDDGPDAYEANHDYYEEILKILKGMDGR